MKQFQKINEQLFKFILYLIAICLIWGAIGYLLKLQWVLLAVDVLSLLLVIWIIKARRKK